MSLRNYCFFGPNAGKYAPDKLRIRTIHAVVPTISRKFTDLLVRVFFSLGKKRPTEDPVNIQYFRKTFCETSQQLLTVKYSCHRCLVGSLIHVCGKKLYENGHRRCFNIFIFDYDTT